MTTKEETLRRIAVMQAWCDGERIEEIMCDDTWMLNLSPPWDWDNSDYRVAPKSKRKVMFLAYVDEYGILLRRCSEAPKHWKRIPSLDLEVEVDD